MRGDVTQQLQQLYYGHQCHAGCTHELITLADDGIDDILKDFALALHSGELGGNGIHAGLYSETARKLTEAITKGMGKVSFGFDDPNNALRAQLLANVHAFSGAKSLTENAVFSELMFDEHGDLKPFKQFFNDVESINKLYNKTYLDVERGDAIAGAQMGLIWNQYDDEDWLEFSTVGDDRVSPEHALLDKITMQKKANFWKTHWPPLRQRCRCTVIPGVKPAIPMTDQEAGVISNKVPLNPGFSGNTGADKVIYTNDHPYFLQRGKSKELDALKNYGLKPVEKILRQDGLPAIQHIDTETDYYAWWDKMVKTNGINATDFVLKDKLGTSVLFDATPTGKSKVLYFKDHIIRKTAENRHEYAVNLVDILQQPDEVWNNADGWFYLKYYNSGLYVVVADIENDIMKAKTMYLVEPRHYKKLRKGVLLK